MSIPARPKITRLRWVSSKDPALLQEWARRIEQRIQIYSIVPKGGKFYLFFTPGDLEGDILSGDLDG